MNDFKFARRVMLKAAAVAPLGGLVSAWGQQDAITARAVEFLKGRQGADGGWSTAKEPGITALVVTALLRSGRVAPGEPVVKKAVAYLEKFLDRENGGFPSAAHANYTTCIALLAFREANKDGQYNEQIARAQAFLKKKQWDETENRPSTDAYFGGAGYGGSNDRPDLSNTSFFIEALRDTGLPADDPALQKALVFVSRCQNMKSEFNNEPWAGKVNDGGFIYTPAKGGQSFAGGDAANGFRSYGGMTYAGLKSMIYAGLKKDDPRIQSALSYIRKHYSLDENPGMGQQGLFYYYHTFAKAMSLLGEETITDSAGKAHNWREELIAALGKRQAADGSWVNPADRFLEGDPNLVTAYALQALNHARKKA
jgi:squalene-hopene/tetraprenyl-beta-curcumene cyclase